RARFSRQGRNRDGLGRGGAGHLYRAGRAAAGHRQFQRSLGPRRRGGGVPAGRGADERHSRPQERILQERRRSPAGDRRGHARRIQDDHRCRLAGAARRRACRRELRSDGAAQSLKEYRAWLARQVEIINHAIKGLPREKIRYHICWGSWPGPHTSDVPFKDIADLVLKVRAGGYSVELANPRHEHEWRLWEQLALPKDTALIPGVISHATNIVEHPELVAERIVRLARL